MVLHGSGRFRICTLEEAVLLVTDLFLLISGRIWTERMVESNEPEDGLRSDDERSSIPSWVKDPKSDEERV